MGLLDFWNNLGVQSYLGTLSQVLEVEWNIFKFFEFLRVGNDLDGQVIFGSSSEAYEFDVQRHNSKFRSSSGEFSSKNLGV